MREHPSVESLFPRGGTKPPWNDGKRCLPEFRNISFRVICIHTDIYIYILHLRTCFIDTGSCDSK